MARLHHLVGASLLSFAVIGCVSQEKYDALKLDNSQLAERLGTSDRQAQANAAEADAYKKQLDALMANASDGKGLAANLQQQNLELQKQLDELNRRYEDAVSKAGSSVVLPPQLNDALTQFAAQNSDLVDFDSARGIVKFKSDLTFATGSADVTPKAEEAIARFASILNSAAAANYELMVVGHTDSARVVNPQTIAHGHKDNWFLSAHRAIAVSEDMQKDGVSSGRIEVAGFADQRPIADNATDGGRAQNRRVEVLILPTTVHSSVASSGAGRVRESHRAAKPALNKDTADTESLRHPALNK